MLKLLNFRQPGADGFFFQRLDIQAHPLVFAKSNFAERFENPALINCLDDAMVKFLP